MYRVVIDTNTLASGAVSSHGPIATLITAWQNGAFDVLLSNEIYVELQRTLGKPYFTTHLSQAAIADYLLLVKAVAIPIVITIPVHGVATHPEDDRILATALSGRADYLITGDRNLRDLGTCKGISIMDARSFITLLNLPEI